MLVGGEVSGGASSSAGEPDFAVRGAGGGQLTMQISTTNNNFLQLAGITPPNNIGLLWDCLDLSNLTRS